MLYFNFESLNVYQLSKELSIELIKETNQFSIKYSRIRDQLIGAAISVPLNLAEGSGRITSKDKINFYKNSRASIYELYAIIDICSSLKLLDKNKYSKKIVIIAKMLSNLLKSQNNQITKN